MTGKGISWLAAGPLLVLFIGGGLVFWITTPEIYLGQIWFAVGLALAIFFGLMARKGREADRIAREGTPGVGRVLEMKETGMQVNDQPLIKLRLLVEVPGIAPYEVTRRLVIPHTALVAFGSGTVPVVVDREDHKKVVVHLAGATGGPAPGASTPIESRLAALDGLRDKGAIRLVAPKPLPRFAPPRTTLPALGRSSAR